ncbi:MAG: GGDEF domain-containing phosphodiesterase [Rhodocyclaceae bacterium]|nr:GGDEF domain-containing phosphodiesterase [Rhodocyclaceae bacterium]
MTITLDNSDGYIDFSSFGLDQEALRSLAAIGPLWRAAVREVAEQNQASRLSPEFFALTAELANSLSNIDWQTNWMHAWHRMHGRGTSLVVIFSIFFQASARCESDLFGSVQTPQKIHIELLSILRRSVVAAVSCAIELGEQARGAEDGIQGELMALRWLGEMPDADLPLAVLSVALDNRNQADQLGASDLQNLPGTLSERLRGLLRPQDRLFAGRDGEWLLLLPSLHSMVQAALAAEQIQRAFAEPISLLSGRMIMLKVVIGAAMMPEHATDGETLLQAARLARWSIVSGRAGFAWYHEGLSCDWQARHGKLEELREALQHDELALYLQPQIEVENNTCVGAELLLRWQRKNGDWVPPPLIVEMLEENGWRPIFTDWLIRQAMRISTDLEAAGINISLSINLTAADMLDSDLPELFAQCLETWGLSGNRFTLELTESVMMVDRDTALTVMHKLKALGFKLALDDFGTGYSSLSYLANLPISEIKIDRSFVIAIFNSLDSLRIVRTIIDLTRDMGMVPLAEGVEDELQQEQLRALGCTLAQGYLYAKPMNLDTFIAWHLARQT